MATIERILVADGDPSALADFQRAVSEARITLPVEPFSDGRQLLDRLIGSPPFRPVQPKSTILILELELPTLSGLEVLEHLHSEPSLRSLPVIVLSSSTHLPDIARAIRLGARSFVPKPKGFDSLLLLVKALPAYWEKWE